MSASNPQLTLAAAIALVRAKGLVVVKTARNTGINSDYASYADVWEALKPALDEAGLSVGFLPGSIRKDNEGWVQSLTMEVSTAADMRSFTFEIVFPEGNRGVNITQRQGMAHTYGRRYALVDFFHIITGDDDDAQRLGMQLRDNEAPTAAPDAHWKDFCYVPVFSTGTLETQGTWANLADPEDPARILGDSAPNALARIWNRHPDDAGLNAWRAELIQERATAKKLTDWNQVRTTYKSLHLPEAFTDCTGDHLNSLALALK
ncbi:MAG TPA: ERF family protein [Prosthecobacter sp.]|nr:ERF family protein [Prosthecobacter sp.]